MLPDLHKDCFTMCPEFRKLLAENIDEALSVVARYMEEYRITFKEGASIDWLQALVVELNRPRLPWKISLEKWGASNGVKPPQIEQKELPFERGINYQG